MCCHLGFAGGFDACRTIFSIVSPFDISVVNRSSLRCFFFVLTRRQLCDIEWVAVILLWCVMAQNANAIMIGSVSKLSTKSVWPFFLLVNDTRPVMISNLYYCATLNAIFSNHLQVTFGLCSLVWSINIESLPLFCRFISSHNVFLHTLKGCSNLFYIV